MSFFIFSDFSFINLSKLNYVKMKKNTYFNNDRPLNTNSYSIPYTYNISCNLLYILAHGKRDMFRSTRQKMIHQIF